ncbi:MAG TPA: hypothetical protein VFX33_05450 [Actinomycetales bacterium]|nr:hypothetical protein [Actinomycetales bacterium]
MTLPPDDVALLKQLQSMWSELDPAPDDLAERSLVAIAMDDLDLELLLLQDASSDLAGARSMVETARTLTFSGERVTVMVTITPTSGGAFRIDGWVAPAVSGFVEIRRANGSDTGAPLGGSAAREPVDADGRFVLLEVPPGMAQLVYHPKPAAHDEQPLRSVAAPPIRL